MVTRSVAHRSHCNSPQHMNRLLRGASSQPVSDRWLQALRLPVALAATLWVTACGGGGGGTGNVGSGSGQPRLLRVEFGRVVDVYGYQAAPEGGVVRALYRRDVLIGSNIVDERGPNENKPDEEVVYDFVGSDPDTLQPRLFIPRLIESPAFAAAFTALDAQVREVAPMRSGTAGPGRPFSVVPRNAAVRLTFSAPLGVDDGFFVQRNEQGLVTGLRNTEAVQLLRITGNPELPGGLAPLPVRIVVGERQLLLDPVLLGTEGQQYQARNTASGLPESADQSSASIRVALAMEGPLAIPSLRETNGLTGMNNSMRKSVIRDFRAGNSGDDSADMARGFVRDPLPLRLIGEMVMYLERVERINDFTQEVTIYKNGIDQEVDVGDVLRFVNDSSGIPFGAAEVVVDPEDDRGQPSVQHVRVRIRSIPGLEAIDPRNLPGYPAAVGEREPWLVLNAPKAVLVAEFTAGSVETGGDDPRYFLSFIPTPLPLSTGVPSPPGTNVSPFAGAVVRFTKPVDMSTVLSADTLFFGMRDLVSEQAQQAFISSRPNSQGGQGMEPAAFNSDKYRTPFLVAAKVYDEDGSQTSLRLQPTSGFYLDSTMRSPPVGADFSYFLHLIAESPQGGIRDLSGNRLDLQGTSAERSNYVVIDFTLDTRSNGSVPFFEDNRVVSIVRRFAARDEDENPSLFLGNEIQAPGAPALATAYPLEDIAGAVVYLGGKIQARPTTRIRQVGDNLNQAPVAAQNSILAWCPPTVSNEPQVSNNSSNTPFGQGIQNPLNPYGCRLQTVWREVDLSLSRTDAYDFNLDVEQMYWAPFTGTTLIYDEFDRVSMFLGHSEYRPLPCIGQFSAMPSLSDSGLRGQFQRNFVWNPAPLTTSATGPIETQPAPHPAYVDVPMVIDPATVVYEPNNINRFLPLPRFRKPYFVFRDETVYEQGGDAGAGVDTGTGSSFTPYLVSPWNHGLGRRWFPGEGNAPAFASSFWNDCRNFQLTTSSSQEFSTGGLMGSIALPLIADFWTYCDSPQLPEGNGYVALGTNGWQISLTAQSSPQPNFRAFSAGRPPLPTQPNPICVGPSSNAWGVASGGYTYPAGGGTIPADNSFYWIMVDFLRRQTVITNGFVDLNNPHRVPEGFSDTRLGPYFLSGGNSTRPADISPVFGYEMEPPLSSLPGGSSVVPQFRAAGAVDGTPWYWDRWVSAATPLYPTAQTNPPGPYTPLANPAQRQALRPTADNFPLDPFKATDAHIRKWDNRAVPGGTQARNWWTYFYNRTVTRYVQDPNQLFSPAFTAAYAGPNESFTPRDIRYLNWRFVIANDVEASPPVVPTIETFSLTYRFQRVF